jgi:hypothetical protein
VRLHFAHDKRFSSHPTIPQPTNHNYQMKHSVHRKMFATLLAAAILSSTSTMRASLVAQFKLEEGAIDPTTNTTWSADGVYSGTLSGATPPAWITTGLSPLLISQGATTAAITNSASGGYVLTTFWGTNANGTSSVLGTNARTVTAWVRTPVAPSASAAAYIVSYGSGSTIVGGRFSLRLDTTAGNTFGKVRLEVSSGSVTGTNSVIVDNNWHHLAVVCQANCRMSNVLLYVDGNLQQNTTTTPTILVNTATNFNPVQIANSSLGLTTSTFLGCVDDVRIYDQVLTSADILNLVYGPGNPPGITQQPQPQSALLGATNAGVTFSVGVSGSPTILYQWKKNGVNIPNATNASISFQPVVAANLAAYSVGITNNYGGTNSASAALSWSTPPVDPTEQTVLVGSNATFSVTMPTDSSGYSYQWQKGGVPIGGATSSAYTVVGAQLTDATNYAVAVTLAGQSATSAPVALHVVVVPSALYPAFVLRDSPSAYWRLGEANGVVTAADVTGFHSGAYSNYAGTELQQSGALTNDVDTASSFTGVNWVEVPAATALQHNTAFALEAWVNVTSASGRQSIICSRNQQFSSGYELAVNGTTYQFRTGNSTSPAGEVWTDLNVGTVTPGVWQHVVASFDGTNKSLYVNGALAGSQITTVLPTPVLLRIGAGLTYNPTPGNYFSGTIDEAAVYWHALSAAQVSDHYLAGAIGTGLPPTWTTQPQSQQAVLGQTNATVTFTAAAVGSPHISYQWKRNSVDLPGQTASALAIQNAGTAGAAAYAVGATNGNGGVLSSNATLSYTTAPITPGNLALLSGGSGAFSVAMPSYQTYTYQWKHAGTNLPGATTSILTLNSVSSGNAGAYSVVATLGPDSAESAPAILTVIPTPSGPYSQIVSNDAPVAWWRLDDAPGSGTAADVFGVNNGAVSSYANDVVLGVEGALLGDSDTAAQFTGYNAYSGSVRSGNGKIDVTYSTALNNPTFSAECWALPNRGYGLTRSPLANVYSGAFQGYAFYAVGNIWEVQVGTGASMGFIALTGPPVVENQWVHLVCTYDGAVASFYVNGSLVSSAALAYVPNSLYPMSIGAGANDTTAGNYFFPGRIDEVAIYTNALSATQVQSHYAAAFPGNAAPHITQQPRSRTTLAGETYTLASAVHGAAPISYQWQHAGTNLPGATTASLVIPSVKPSDAGNYQLVATRGSGTASSAAASLAVITGEAVSGNLEGNSSGTIAASGGRAGYVNLGNWNEMEFTSLSGSKTNLINNKGQTNNMIATWSSSNYRAWTGPVGVADGDAAMLNGFLDTSTSGSSTLTLANIPANYQSAGYSLYCYMGAPYYAVGIVNSGDSFGAVNVGASTNYYHAIDLALWDGNYLQATNSDPTDPSPADANYVVFTNLNAASVTIQVTPHPMLTGPGSLSGFQLVANTVVPVPLVISQQGGNIVLSWTGTWVLQRTSALNPNVWTDVSGATSPYTVPTPLQAQQYYRLRSP